MADTERKGVARPSAQIEHLALGILLRPPLLRRKDRGPPLILVTVASPSHTTTSDFLLPPQKWAEEGFTVIEIQTEVFKSAKDAERAFAVAERAFEESASCEGSKIGLVGEWTRSRLEIGAFADSN